MSKRTDQEEFYYRAKIDRMAQEILDDAKRKAEFHWGWSDAWFLALLVVAVLVSIAGCLRAMFKW